LRAYVAIGGVLETEGVIKNAIEKGWFVIFLFGV
jgi:hypothetical protein